MARIRSIKPEFWTDSTVVGLSTHARLLFIGCWNFADDYGVLEDDSTRLKLQILPAEPVNADDLVEELVKAACLVRAVAPDGTPVLVVRTWERHQKVDRRSVGRWGDPADFPPPPPVPAGPRRVPSSPPEPSTSPAEPSESASDLRPPDPAESPRALVDGREGKGREGSRSTPSPDGDGGAQRRRQRGQPQLEVVDDGMPPTKAADGMTLAQTIAAWCQTRDADLPPPTDRPAVFRALVAEVIDHRGEHGKHAHGTCVGVVGDYLADATDDDVERDAWQHLRRLVSTFGALRTFDGCREAVVWGAGLGEHKCPLALTKYAAAVLERQRAAS